MLQGIFLDLEGVVYQDQSVIPGALEAIDTLNRGGLRCRYVTNTTTQPRSAIAERMSGMGLSVDPDYLMTPPVAAGLFLAGMHASRIHLAAAESLVEDFHGFELVGVNAENIDAIVLGDLYRDFTWQRLNDLFQVMAREVPLVALHKNRMCRRAEGLSLDLGPFVAALEYASAVRAHVVGKPSATFFKLALEKVGLSANEVLMVGDDIEADIGGAKAAGLVAVQVKTGKYRRQDEDHPSVTADGRVNSLADLPRWITGHAARQT
ncbi:MAG TPA: TIGR01458 family HAD-type hydrolase [Alphaproteobacteria bacterium]|nr:TIGR01458 family HAD-type hydrolase [Alphaproteobacteria bacterium]